MNKRLVMKYLERTIDTQRWDYTRTRAKFGVDHPKVKYHPFINAVEAWAALRWGNREAV